MSSFAVDKALDARPTAVEVTDDVLRVELDDGRTITVPTIWFPRLHHGKAEERANVEILPLGIHWPDLDEDISVRGLLLGEKSGENPRSIQWWLKQRAKGRRTTFQDYMNEAYRRPRAKPRAAASNRPR